MVAFQAALVIGSSYCIPEGSICRSQQVMMHWLERDRSLLSKLELLQL